MRLTLVAVGRMKAGPERELLGRYVDRATALARSVGLSSFAMREVDESRARLPAERRRDEARSALADFPIGGFILALDERGRSLSSLDIARLIGGARDAGRAAATIVVGGPDGLDAGLRERADAVVAFGAATFPHQLIRVMAAEQIYRAMTILADHPYHRA